MISKKVSKRHFCKFFYSILVLVDHGHQKAVPVHGPLVKIVKPGLKLYFREEEDELSWEDIQRLTAAFVVCVLGTAAHKGNDFRPRITGSFCPRLPYGNGLTKLFGQTLRPKLLFRIDILDIDVFLINNLVRHLVGI